MTMTSEPKRFYLERDSQRTVEGVLWPDGSVSIYVRNSGFCDRWNDLHQIRDLYRDDKTGFVWVDQPDSLDVAPDFWDTP